MCCSTFKSEDRELSRRVLILAPLDGDAGAVWQVLTQGGFDPHVCADVRSVCGEMSHGGIPSAGAVIVAQEAMGPGAGEDAATLSSVLANQPEWSDLPLILLASPSIGEDAAWDIARRLDPVGNITILERPLRRTTLLNAVNVALRARARQYDLRKTLAELGEHKDRLGELVEKRTAELAASVASLHAAERLASLGTLATGLGHDIANLTLPIRASLDALRVGDVGSTMRADLDAIGSAMAHLGRLSAGMRLMGIDPERESATGMTENLKEWAAETAPMFRAALPRGVRFECAVKDDLSVRVARHRLAQAVFNLVQNAGEALAERACGEVRVSAERAGNHEHAGMVRICVEDDGPGMTEEIVARCFEPYFSTKGRAIATGMGLGMVKGIVEAAGGSVSVVSAPGKGAAFTLMLPALARDWREQHEPVVCAITLASGRSEGLIRMFLEQVGMEGIVFREEGTPTAPVWVLDSDGASRAIGFVREDPGRRAILIGEARDGGTDSLLAGAEIGARVRRVADSPSPAALRDAISWARPRGTTEAKT